MHSLLAGVSFWPGKGLLLAGDFAGHLKDTHLHSCGAATAKPYRGRLLCARHISQTAAGSCWGPQGRQRGTPVKMTSACLEAVSGKHYVCFCSTDL